MGNDMFGGLKNKGSFIGDEIMTNGDDIFSGLK